MEVEYLTRSVTLPVYGKEAVVREANLRAQQLLFDRRDKVHEALPDYWAHCTVRIGNNEQVTREDILDLRLPDQHVLAIEIYRATMGDELKLSADGAEGREEGFIVDLSKLILRPLPPGVEGPDPTFTVRLPRSKSIILFGYPTGRQELEESAKEGFDPTRLALMAIRKIDGVEQAKYRAISAWPLQDHKAFVDALAANDCGYDPRVRFTDSRGRGMVRNILTDPSFLFPSLGGPELEIGPPKEDE